MARQPIYYSVYTSIKSDILKGVYEIGSLLPSETELQSQFNVSRTTVRKAVEILAAEGYLSIKQGKGTAVIDHTIKQSYNYMNSFTETLRAKGFTVAIRNLTVSRVAADDVTAKALRVPVGEELTCIQRIPLANGRPAAIITNYIPSRLVVNLEQHKDEIVSLYRHLESRYNLVIDNAHDAITARAATFEQACALDCAVGAPMLYTRRICFQAGAPVSYDLVYALAEIGPFVPGGKTIAYEIDISLTGRPKYEGA